MKSRLILDVATTALLHSQGTVTDFESHPVGLFTLIAVAVSSIKLLLSPKHSPGICSLSVQ